MRLILASTSPRRRDILSLLGVPFEVVAPRYEEVHDPRLPPEQQAMRFAREKARSVQSQDAVVIGSDTVVVIDDVVLGKPVDLDEARRMLHRLRGRTHRVLTAVAVLAPDLPDEVWCETAEVRMHAATDAEIEAYLRTGESMDKAGAYAFQGDGGRLVAGVDGDCFVVIGLPLRSVADTLRRIGIPVSADLDRLYEQSTDLLAR